MIVKNDKAFTIIELIVVIAIIGILVLFGAPKLLGYVQKAQLARIQHDVRIMEDEMELALKDGLAANWIDWDTNYKNLFNIVAREQLFETEGVAESVDMSYMRYQPFKSKFLTPDKGKKIAEGLEDLEIEAGLGGPLILSGENEDINDKIEVSPHTDYKVIPANYKGIINTRLKGTFYVNSLGKVYYEPNKPISHKPIEKGPNCSVIPAPDYEFEHITGTIVKYIGSSQHITIPSQFLVEGKCWPVRIIGKGAFSNGGYKTINVPGTVEKIEDGAFKDNNLEEVIIERPEGSVDIGNGAFDNNGKNGDTPIEPTYKPPIDNNVIIKPKKDKDGNIIGGIIISGGNNGSGNGSSGSGSGGSGGNGNNGDSGGGTSSSSNNDTSNKIISIPDHVVVGGKEIPIIGIEEGAYQGQGLISIILPEGLEIIEDYAFAGN